MTERISILLPLSITTVSTIMLAVGEKFPGAKLVDPSPEEKAQHGEMLALTHCLCWGAAWRMLDYLLANPDAYERLRRAT